MQGWAITGFVILGFIFVMFAILLSMKYMPYRAKQYFGLAR